MKFQKQLNKHDPDNGVWGDCYRTCIACLLDLEPSQVQNFCEKDSHKQDTRMWLAERGLFLIEIPFIGRLENILAVMRHYNRGAYFILSGMSANKVPHAVICDHTGIIWDPSQDNSGIVGPIPDDNGEAYYWIEFFVPFHLTSIYKRDMHRARFEAQFSAMPYAWKMDRYEQEECGPHNPGGYRDYRVQSAWSAYCFAIGFEDEI